MQGSYLELAKTGELERRAAQAKELLRECRLCPRQCRVDRLKGEQGFCRTGRLAEIASYGPHFGEESPLVGSSLNRRSEGPVTDRASVIHFDA